jgi:hypothetical protein
MPPEGFMALAYIFLSCADVLGEEDIKKNETHGASVAPPLCDALQELPPLYGKIDNYFLAKFNGRVFNRT